MDDSNNFDTNDLTIVDDGALPMREISRDPTREHETDPGLLEASAGRRELNANAEWVLTFNMGGAARQADLRRATLCELVERGATASAAEEFWRAVLKRSVDDDGKTA